MKQGIFEPVDNRASVLASISSIDLAKPFVVQLDGPVSQIRRQTMEAIGLDLLDYVPNNAMVVRLGNASPTKMASLGFVRWVGPFQNEWKLDPTIGQRAYASPRRLATQSRGEIQVVVTLFKGEQANQALVALTEVGASVIGASHYGRQWLIDVVVPQAKLQDLAALGAVQYIEDAPEGRLRNDSNEWVLQSNQMGQTPIWEAGIHGEGQIAGLIDGTIDEAHCAFDDTEPIGPTHRKIVALRNAIGLNTHGTHVVGTLAGDLGTWGEADQYDGLAFAAKISFSEVQAIFSLPSTLFDRLLDAHNDGARVHSNSWGDDGTTAYTTWSRQIDDFSYTFEDDLVLFAVTNDAALRTPENAKNVLAVGATQHAPNQQNHCSGGIGPTSDSRRKPEIYAPGCGTNSADALTSCGIFGDTGTSMACPAVAGAAVLVRQYFVDGYHPTGLPVNASITPSGALMKAVLLNSAVDMAGIAGYPSDLEGWGRLAIDNSLNLPGDGSRMYVIDIRNASGLATGESLSYPIPVIGDGAPFNVTMVFTGPPALINSVDPVINNLDLEVVAPDATPFLGNWFAGGQSVTGGGPDARNNVERVKIDQPLLGTYTVSVSATAVNQGLQGFALVISGDIRADCNANGILDTVDIANLTSTDCNSNEIPDECEPDCDGSGTADECDISGGTLIDANGDGIPDVCCPVAADPQPEAGSIPKNKFISFMPGGTGAVSAIQVALTDNGLFPAVIGSTWWVGPPDPATGRAFLQCMPEYRDWSADPAVIHVGCQEITSDATYTLQAIGLGCDLGHSLSYSAPLNIPTAVEWGDCVGVRVGDEWGPPNGVVNGIDISAALSNFLDKSFAPPNERVDVDPTDPNGVVSGNDILRLVNAFRDRVYPFNAPQPCP